MDQDLCVVESFCRVCFFPRLVEFILTQDWNDPKSRLQQCCLTLRRIDQCEPDVPSYRVLDVRGPTNSRLFQVGVYFRKKRLADGASFFTTQLFIRSYTLYIPYEHCTVYCPFI